MEKTYLVTVIVRDDCGDEEEGIARFTQEQMAVLEWLTEWSAITSYNIIADLSIDNLTSEEYCTKVNQKIYEARERGDI
jgi:hypothetical protein